jgi:hypothetical protein
MAGDEPRVPSRCLTHSRAPLPIRLPSAHTNSRALAARHPSFTGDETSRPTYMASATLASPALHPPPHRHRQSPIPRARPTSAAATAAPVPRRRLASAALCRAVAAPAGPSPPGYVPPRHHPHQLFAAVRTVPVRARQSRKHFR